MKIIFCHHAQRARDRSKPREEWQNDDLTKLGRKDAATYAKMLKKSKIQLTAIYSSPFFRCSETAKIINKYQNSEIIFDDRLNEFGSLPEESWQQCHNRVISVINEITERYAQKDIILVVTSGVNLSAFICWAYGLKPTDNMPFLGVTSCSPIIFNYDKQPAKNQK